MEPLMTNITSTRSRPAYLRQLLPTTLAAGAIVAGALVSAAPANAAGDLFISLSVGNGFDYKAGMAVNADQGAASTAANSNCQNAGGGNCVVRVSTKNGCAAVAVGGVRDEYVTGSGPTVQMARTFAMKGNQGGRIVVSGCTATLNPSRSPG
jgi:hypothetical protein